jgi:hypothetical protein
LKEKGAFEHKNVAMLGNTETIEQTFQRVLGQEKPKILFGQPGSTIAGERMRAS